MSLGSILEKLGKQKKNSKHPDRSGSESIPAMPNKAAYSPIGEGLPDAFELPISDAPAAPPIPAAPQFRSNQDQQNSTVRCTTADDDSDSTDYWTPLTSPRNGQISDTDDESDTQAMQCYVRFPPYRREYNQYPSISPAHWGVAMHRIDVPANEDVDDVTQLQMSLIREQAQMALLDATPASMTAEVDLRLEVEAYVQLPSPPHTDGGSEDVFGTRLRIAQTTADLDDGNVFLPNSGVHLQFDAAMKEIAQVMENVANERYADAYVTVKVKLVLDAVVTVLEEDVEVADLDAIGQAPGTYAVQYTDNGEMWVTPIEVYIEFDGFESDSVYKEEESPRGYDVPGNESSTAPTANRDERASACEVATDTAADTETAVGKEWPTLEKQVPPTQVHSKKTKNPKNEDRIRSIQDLTKDNRDLRPFIIRGTYTTRRPVKLLWVRFTLPWRKTYWRVLSTNYTCPNNVDAPLHWTHGPEDPGCPCPGRETVHTSRDKKLYDENGNRVTVSVIVEKPICTSEEFMAAYAALSE